MVLSIRFTRDLRSVRQTGDETGKTLDPHELQQVENAEPTELEEVLSQSDFIEAVNGGGVNGFIAQCYFSKNCPVALGFMDKSGEKFGDKPDLLALATAVAVGGGYVVDFNTSFQVMEAAAKLKTLFQALESSRAFDSLALRTNLGVDQDDAYAILRYDALSSGEAGIAVYNLKSEPSTITVTMPAAAIGQRPTDLVSGKQLSKLGNTYKVKLQAHGYAFLGKLKPGKWTRRGYKNCYVSAGASSGSAGPVTDGPMSIAACFDTCLENGDCEGVTVEWVDDGKVNCLLREGIDIKKCDDDKDKTFTTFTRN